MEDAQVPEGYDGENMTKKNEVYKCNICGNIVEMLHEGVGELVCCGQPMELKVEQTKENEGEEKHVPVIEKTETGIKVKIGSVPHPMEAAHHIEWIEVLADGESYKKFLKPTDEPVAEFPLKADKLTAREYCNIHGLWKKEQ